MTALNIGSRYWREIINEFIKFVIVDGAVLFTLFFVVSFIVALLQQNTSMAVLTQRLSTMRYGVGHVYAALGGAITPFCSCSTVPVLSGMVRAQIRFGVCFTFLLASPLVNEAVMVVMWQYFGASYLIWFLLLALSLPVVFGVLADGVRLEKYLRAQPVQYQEMEDRELISTQKGSKIPLSAKMKFSLAISKNETYAMLPYLGIGLLIGGAIYGFVPDEFITGLQANVDQSLLVVIMALLGIPFYFNILAVLPIAFALTEKGVGIGAVTAFLVSGAGTSLPELILLFKLFKTQLLLAHVGAVFLAAIAIGMFFTVLFN